MVFWDRSSHKLRDRQVGDSVCITQDVPVELLLQIFEDLPRSDLLALRLVHRNLANVASSELQDRLRTLYIHPSTTSLRRAAAICEDTFFSQKIENVVLLGSFPTKEVIHLRGAHTTKAIPHLSPWPEFWPQPKGVLQQTPIYTRRKCARLLAKLPRFKSLAFSDHVEAPGLNQISKTIIESHSKRGLESPCDANAMTDSEMLLRLIHRTATIEELHLDVIMPFARHFIKRREQELVKHFSHLTSLSLNLETDIRVPTIAWSEKWPDCCRLFLHSVSPETLHTLRITLSGNNMHQRVPDCSDCLARVAFGTLRWRNLKRFELLRQPDPRHKRPQRPTVLETQVDIDEPGDDLLGFFAAHAETLETVRIRDVLFETRPGDGPGDMDRDTADAVSSVESIVRTLQKAGVKDVEYFITTFGHHEWCKKTKQPNMDRCRHDCGIYGLRPDASFIRASDFEALAESLGVAKNEERNGWDFGKAMMLHLDDSGVAL